MPAARKIARKSGENGIRLLPHSRSRGNAGTSAGTCPYAQDPARALPGVTALLRALRSLTFSARDTDSPTFRCRRCAATDRGRILRKKQGQHIGYDMVPLFSIAALCDDPRMHSQFSSGLPARPAVGSSAGSVPLAFSGTATSAVTDDSLPTVCRATALDCRRAVAVRDATQAVFPNAGAHSRIGWMDHHRSRSVRVSPKCAQWQASAVVIVQAVPATIA